LFQALRQKAGMPVLEPTEGSLMHCFARTLPIGLATYCLLRFWLLGDHLQVADALAWIHSTLAYEQKAKLLYILEMGWLNLPEHDV